MPRNRPSLQIPLSTIADFIQGHIVGDHSFPITGASGLEEASPGDIVFVMDDRLLSQARKSKAGAFVVHRSMADCSAPQIVVSHPAQAFAKLVHHFFVPPKAPRGIAEQICRGDQVQIGTDPSIWPQVTLGHQVHIGDRVTIYPGVYIGEEAVIGDDCILYPNVVIREGMTIGNRVVIHSGTVVGSDGFGYVQDQGQHCKVPQIGTVVIEDDVEIGANVTIDRATFGETRIRRGTKIDNLVQIAHNVVVGENSILVAQVGIAGSTTLGHHVMVGGQVGIADHLHIGNQAMIAAGAGVHKNVEPGQIVSGMPALPHETSLKAHVVIARLPEMRQQVRDMEQRLKKLETAKPSPLPKKRPAKKK